MGSPVHLLHIFRVPFLKNTSDELLLRFRFLIVDFQRAHARWEVACF